MSTQETERDTGLLSVRRTATRLGIHRGTCYRLIRNGVIPAHMVGGSIRVDEELERWLAERLIR